MNDKEADNSTGGKTPPIIGCGINMKNECRSRLFAHFFTTNRSILFYTFALP